MFIVVSMQDACLVGEAVVETDDDPEIQNFTGDAFAGQCA